jgi:predicted adenylyl cyclase CyaB
MEKNIEIKAILRNREEVEARAQAMADGPCRILRQRDTFFQTPRGRLKIRVEGRDREQLIYYERPDDAGAKTSFYEIVETETPSDLEKIMSMALGIRGRVVKERTLYLTGPTRIHLDRVQGLGDFMELEVVMDDSMTRFEGVEIAEDLMHRLGIPESDRIEGAYMDLLEAADLVRRDGASLSSLEKGGS